MKSELQKELDFGGYINIETDHVRRIAMPPAVFYELVAYKQRNGVLSQRCVIQLDPYSLRLRMCWNEGNKINTWQEDRDPIERLIHQYAFLRQIMQKSIIPEVPEDMWLNFGTFALKRKLEVIVNEIESILDEKLRREQAEKKESLIKCA